MWSINVDLTLLEATVVDVLSGVVSVGVVVQVAVVVLIIVVYIHIAFGSPENSFKLLLSVSGWDGLSFSCQTQLQMRLILSCG